MCFDEKWVFGRRIGLGILLGVDGGGGGEGIIKVCVAMLEKRGREKRIYFLKSITRLYF